MFTLWGRWMLLMQTDIWKSLNGTQLFPTKSTSFRFVFTNTLTCYKGPTSLIWADFSFLFGSVNIFKSPFMPKKFASHVVLANAIPCFSKVLYFCIGFWELFHLTRDLSQAEKKINVVTSWVTNKLTTCIFAHHVTTFVSFSAWDSARSIEIFPRGGPPL